MLGSYLDPIPREMLWIRIRQNDADPYGSGLITMESTSVNNSKRLLSSLFLKMSAVLSKKKFLLSKFLGKGTGKSLNIFEKERLGVYEVIKYFQYESEALVERKKNR
jgi:hypothetical protein